MHGDGSAEGGATCAPARRAMPAVRIMFVFATCLGSAAAEAQCVVSDCRTAHPPTPAARVGAFRQLKNGLTGKGWGAHGGAEPRILRRVNSHPIIRVKSYGELSSVEYDELINKLFDATRKGDLNTCFELVKAGAWEPMPCSWRRVLAALLASTLGPELAAPAAARHTVCL
ncbi:MAG: hypothetical protein ACPIOQ_53680, partial [Promethearchaeia archaeon]